MAKRKRAPARRGCTILRPPVQTAQQTRSARSRRPTYTPELLAQARYDFEHTDRPKRASRSISGWRDPHSGILQEAKAGSVLCRRHAACHLPCGCGARSKSLRPRRKRPLDPVENLQSAMPAVGDTVERLYRAVLAELAVENLRAQLKREPQGTQDAERTVRTLSSLTETLQKLQRLKSAVPNTGSQDDDLPADIDEFCKELARRIEAFVPNHWRRRC